ncbi:hypothetical protein T439DRAFT_324753 [Meredithblackwellia eburnea MCA 4105]
MHFLTTAASLLIASLVAVSPVTAAIDTGNQFIDYTPKVTYPDSTTQWIPGVTYSVFWNNTDPGYPAEQLHTTADIWLGFVDDTGLNYDKIPENPLAVDVPLYGGNNWTQISIPSNLTSRNTYVINLRGSSGNVSPQFEISWLAAVGLKKERRARRGHGDVVV